MLYIIYDPALNGLPGLISLQHLYPLHQSIFRNTKDEMLWDVAPYLFLVEENFAEKIKDLDVSVNGVIVVESNRALEKMLTHFQRFIYQTVNKKEYFFRFWDGGVLEKFLPTCEEAQLKMFFDGVQNYTIKTAQGIKQFSFTPYGLKTEKIDIGKPGILLGRAEKEISN